MEIWPKSQINSQRKPLKYLLQSDVVFVSYERFIALYGCIGHCINVFLQDVNINTNSAKIFPNKFNKSARNIFHIGLGLNITYLKANGIGLYKNLNIFGEKMGMIWGSRSRNGTLIRYVQKYVQSYRLSTYFLNIIWINNHYNIWSMQNADVVAVKF